LPGFFLPNNHRAGRGGIAYQESDEPRLLGVGLKCATDYAFLKGREVFQDKISQAGIKMLSPLFGDDGADALEAPWVASRVFRTFCEASSSLP
jgi:hypothetical protein